MCLLMAIVAAVLCEFEGVAANLAGIAILVVAIYVSSCATKRLHDLERNGWMQLSGLIPVVIRLLVSSGSASTNKYGMALAGQQASDRLTAEL